MKAKLTLLVILSTILTACSGGSGGSNGNPTGTNVVTSENRTILRPGTTIIGDLKDPTELEKLLTTIKEQPNLTAGSCNNAVSSLCYRETAKGTILGSYEQSYSSFAAIRNDYRDHNGQPIENTPANSFIALATLPTSDRSSIVNATYRGQVSYSTRNNPSITSRELVMVVDNNRINGSVVSTSGSGVNRNVMTFKEAEIIENNGQIAFNGDVIFHKEAFLIEAGTNNTYDTDIQGKYQGIFAGNKGEEVVGSFHSNNTEANTSIQGAFGAKRQ
ncbi:hypothetical protein ACWIYZ_10960 [Ursidibacter arcticus]